MKRKSIQQVIFPVTSIALVTAFSISTAVGANSQSAYSDKQNAEEYWAEFKQDSEQTWEDSKDAFRDGWVEGKLETALVLNEHLNPFEIDISVDDDVATLKGEVGSDIDKELAQNVALGIEGIDEVDNQLTVKADTDEMAQEDEGRGFSQYMRDISTTAAIKTELLASSNVNGIAIDVDTYNDEVTLSGTVETDAQRKLAEAIVTKRGDVDKVVNKLEVNS
ncbi:BON domain-containing protein [Gilvimarinus algae]|uniref:BON domain-containing protein n=1 Tax=Gilvimarinus algae TaxID=3058037 RepID=A0ABT8THV0_9GAMM|nr:BON domain-containing protein [Gilvimarinus sp. SDUM040014]MDO3383496.1 BON domain-containing protein [Gilvimarinus sp. SDUM040014]